MILQTTEKKSGLIKDLIVKLKQKDQDAFRRFSMVVRQSQNHFLNRFVKELVKQGYLAANTTLPRNSIKTNHQLLQSTFNWQKPNVSGATSVYNFRKRDSTRRESKKQR
jgi:tRNA G26 N,N-dimethylase Trm1